MTAGWILIYLSYYPPGLAIDGNAHINPIQVSGRIAQEAGMIPEVYKTIADCDNALIVYALSNPFGHRFKVERFSDTRLIARAQMDEYFFQIACINIEAK